MQLLRISVSAQSADGNDRADYFYVAVLLRCVRAAFLNCRWTKEDAERVTGRFAYVAARVRSSFEICMTYACRPAITSEFFNGTPMKRLVTVIVLLHLAAATSMARDWESIINQLEREPRTEKVTKQIAVCCNNYAIELQRKSEWTQAEKWMKRAIDTDRSGGYESRLAMIYLNQAFELFKKRTTRNFNGYMHRHSKLLAQRALAYDRTLADAHVLIGEIEYINQKLPAAKRAWENALRLDPHSGLESRLAKVGREIKVESKFSTNSNAYFEVCYQNSVDDETGAGLRLAMDTARGVVGKDFSYRPNHKVVVLVYSAKSFSKLRLGPHWAGGLYDGKIRLPLDGQENLKFAVATLFHEYTHAIIHDLAKGNCPRWLNEGLSELQGEKIEASSDKLLQMAAATDKLIPLDDLDYAFQSSDTGAVVLGYQQSRSLASYLTKNHGYRRVRNLLELLGKDTPLEIALRRSCNVSLTQLEAKWKEWLPRDLASSN